MRIVIVLAAASLLACQSAPEGNLTAAGPRTNAETRATPSATATDSPADGRPEPAADLKPLPPYAEGVEAAIETIHEYYEAIAARDYRRAYELWSGKGAASGQTFEQFRDGFANTASVEIDTGGEPGRLEGAAGSQYATVPIRIRTNTKDGREQSFSGEYVLRRSMVDGATPEQRSWRIYSAKIRELPR